MRRHIPGLHSERTILESNLDGLFLVRIDKAAYQWHPRKPFLALRLMVLQPKPFASQTISSRLYCTHKALWKLNWFLRDFGYDNELLGRDQIDEKALCGLQGVVRTSQTVLNGRTYQNLDGFAPATEWDGGPTELVNKAVGKSDAANL